MVLFIFQLPAHHEMCLRLRHTCLRWVPLGAKGLARRAERLALDELHGGAAARGDEGHLVGQAELVDGGHRVAAADDGVGLLVGGHGLGHGPGAGLRRSASRRRPWGRSRTRCLRHGDGLGVQRGGLGADVEAHHAVGDLVHRARWRGLASLGEAVGHHARPRAAAACTPRSAAFCDHLAGALDPIVLHERGAHGFALGRAGT